MARWSTLTSPCKRWLHAFKLQLFTLQQESKNTVAVTDERENCSRKNARENRKPISSSIDEQPPVKLHKDLAQNLETCGNNKGQARDSIQATEVAKLDNKAETRSSNETKDRSPKKPIPFDDQCTAFISNLSLEATEEDLRNFFGANGGVVDIRILTDKFTKKSRGLAYVDFSDDAHLAAAVEKNKRILLGKKLRLRLEMLTIESVTWGKWIHKKLLKGEGDLSQSLQVRGLKRMSS